MKELIFTKQRIVKAFKLLPPIKTPVMDEFFTARSTYPGVYVPVSEVAEIAKNRPLVRRGGNSIQIGGDERKVSVIEPQPIDLSTFLSAVEINNLKTMDDFSVTQYVASKIRYLRDNIRRTTEALCSASLRGVFTYAIKTESGFESYTVDYGTPQSYTPSKKWDQASLAEIDTQLEEMLELLEDEGFGFDPTFYIGKEAFGALAAKIYALSNDTRIEASIENGAILLNGKRLKRIATKYYDYTQKKAVKAIGDKEVFLIDRASGFSVIYAAIDNLNAGLQATPLFVQEITRDDGKGSLVTGTSKPLPIPVVKAIKRATVL